MLVKAQAAATAARRLKRKVEEEEEELADLASKIIERADQVLGSEIVLRISLIFGVPGGGQIGEVKPGRSIRRLVNRSGKSSWLRLSLSKMNTYIFGSLLSSLILPIY